MKWAEKMKENITTAGELKEVLHLTEEQADKMEKIIDMYPMAIPPYYLSLIDPQDPEDPIRKMCIPSVEEFDTSGSYDTSGEAENTVSVGLQHKYSQTAMVLSTQNCAMYCRHCFRKRLVGLPEAEVMRQMDDIMTYIGSHSEIDNVLVSGGDAFLNSNQVIERYLRELTEMDHIKLIRFGTRIPVVFPERVSDDSQLLAMLREYGKKKQIYVVTQFNHPNEITEESREAVRLLRESGVVVKNQTVLLKGVNDDAQVLGTLLSQLVSIGIVPYYIFQCRPVTGVKSQFQVPLVRGYEIVEGAKRMQNGQGKCIRYIMSHETGKVEILGKMDGGTWLFKYHQAKKAENMGRIFAKEIDDNQCWLEEIQDDNPGFPRGEER